MATLTALPEIAHPHIAHTPGTCGGKPRIAGTRIKVSLIAREYEQDGLSPHQIAEAHPHLTLAQIHAALSYFYDHQAEIAEELEAEAATLASFI